MLTFLDIHDDKKKIREKQLYVAMFRQDHD